MTTAPSLFIATPYVRPHAGAYTRSLLAAPLPLEVSYKDPFGMPIDAARNFLIESFKLSKADYCLFIDNDCGFTPNAIKRLMDYELPMISACMYTKDFPPRPTMGRFVGVDDQGKDYYSWSWAVREIIEFCRKNKIDKIEKNEYEFEPTDNDLREVDGCGFHFTLIRRDVIEKVKPPYFVMLGKSGAGEDFYFSKKVKEAGYPIYFDIGLHTAHYAGEENSYGLRELLIMSKYVPLDEIVEDGPFAMGGDK
jgi:glycosyltransferase involved in cell wall biosynthesis